MSLFSPVFRAQEVKPKTQSQNSRSAATSVIFKDALPISSWLAIGASLNSILLLALGRIALAIPVTFLAVKLLNALLIANGIKANPYTVSVVPGKYSAQLPNPDGTFGPAAANQGVTVLLIGTRSNHPMGLLAPGFKESGQYMTAMQTDIDARAEEFGLINSTQWVGAEREAGNEIMYVMYFKTYEGLHRYAHSDLHRQAWSWWNKTYAEHSHLSIWHESYQVPAGSWETIYGNSHPTLLGGGVLPIKTEAGKQWISPIVDASRGLLKSSKGRMSTTLGQDNDGYGHEPYQALAQRSL